MYTTPEPPGEPEQPRTVAKKRAVGVQRLFTLSTQKWVLLVPFVNWWIIAVLALGNVFRQDREVGAKLVKVLLSIIACTVVLGIGLSIYIVVLGNSGLLFRKGPAPMLAGLYVCTLLMGISYIICQKIIGVED